MSDQEIRELEARLRADPQDRALRLMLLRRYLQTNQLSARILEDLALLNDSAARTLVTQLGLLEKVPDRTFSAVKFLFAMKSVEPQISRQDYLNDAVAMVQVFGEQRGEGGGGAGQNLAWLYREAVSTMDSFENMVMMVFGDADLRQYLNQGFTEDRMPSDPEPIHRLRLASENMHLVQPWFEERVIAYLQVGERMARLLDSRHDPRTYYAEEFRIIRYLNSKLRAYIRLYWELQTHNRLDYHRREGLQDFIRAIKHYRPFQVSPEASELVRDGRRALIKYLLPNYTPE